jgi:hypothetical protein
MRFIQTVLALITLLFAVDAASTRWAVAETCQTGRFTKIPKIVVALLEEREPYQNHDIDNRRALGIKTS